MATGNPYQQAYSNISGLMGSLGTAAGQTLGGAYTATQAQMQAQQQQDMLKKLIEQYVVGKEQSAVQPTTTPKEKSFDDLVNECSEQLKNIKA